LITIAAQLLHTVGVQWAESRRRAGATVFEGNWGPADEILAEDAEMIDV
jgi:mitosis inhibitor protein kinase SWE1